MPRVYNYSRVTTSLLNTQFYKNFIQGIPGPWFLRISDGKLYYHPCFGSCDQKPKNLDSSTISHPNFYDKCVFTTLLENFNGFQIFVRNVNTSKYRNGSSSFYKDLWTCKVIRAIFIWSIFKRAVIDHMTCYNLSWPKIKL